LRMAAQQLQRVRRLLLVSAGGAQHGFHPEMLPMQAQVGAAMAEAMKGTLMYKSYAAIAPRPHADATRVQARQRDVEFDRRPHCFHRKWTCTRGDGGLTMHLIRRLAGPHVVISPLAATSTLRAAIDEIVDAAGRPDRLTRIGSVLRNITDRLHSLGALVHEAVDDEVLLHASDTLTIHHITLTP
jgi:hypothetical protein